MGGLSIAHQASLSLTETEFICSQVGILRITARVDPSPDTNRMLSSVFGIVSLEFLRIAALRFEGNDGFGMK